VLRLFVSQARKIFARWVDDYNIERLHAWLSYPTPAAFAAELENQQARLTRPLLRLRLYATTLLGP
jgi:putative transposase